MEHSITLSPYINTSMYCMITLPPNQLTNEVYQNLKAKLIRKYERRCFRKYGYIMKVFEIQRYEAAPLQAENPHVSAPFRIKFSCRLCVPLEKQHVICKIEKLSELFLVLSNGPIYMIVTIDRKNDSVFFVDNNNRLRYRQDDKSVLVKQGDFVKVSIESKTFNDSDIKIKALGFLQDIATETEIEKFYGDLYQTLETGEIVEYMPHIKEMETQLAKEKEEEMKKIDDETPQMTEEISEASDEVESEEEAPMD